MRVKVNEKKNLRCSRDLLKRNRKKITGRRRGNIHWRYCLFHLRLVWDIIEINWENAVIRSYWDVVTTFQHDVVEKKFRRDVCLVFHFRRTYEVPGINRETSLQHQHNVTMKYCCRVSFLWIKKKILEY